MDFPCWLLAAALSLGGVTGSDLRARAFFDVNNARVGDPLVLTIDFIGTADFAGLHPPALARAVDRGDWKVDDASAKTDTFRDAKRLTWRIRPRREGVLWFPALTFAYADATGGTRTVTANAIPVHAKKSGIDAKDVVGAEMGRDETAMPQPDALVGATEDVRRANGALRSDEAWFAWRKACAKPTADAFAAFDFPAARMNEARCAILDGNWARALRIYSRLEWTVGQTPAIERGLLAALALKYANPLVELPVWRQVGRPLLRYGWRGRVGWVAGGLAALVALLLLLGRLVRALAVVALAVLLPLPSAAETVVTTVTNANGSVTVERIEKDAGGNVVSRMTTTTSGGGSFSFSSSSSSGGARMPASGFGSPFGGRDPFSMFDDFDPFGSRRRARARYPKVEIGVTLAPDKPSVTVGEDFNLILTLDAPQFISFSDGIRLALDEENLLVSTGNPQTLRLARSPNPTNVLHRILFPMRANRPFGDLHFAVSGGYLYRGESSFFAQATPWSSGARTARFAAREPPPAGRPADWRGIVATSARLTETCDLVRPETNDVVTVTYRLDWTGYVPPDWMPEGAAFEWTRSTDGTRGSAEWRRYVVADGVASTPKVSFSWYDPKRKRYLRAETGATRLSYRSH